eukprot:CAMPEP_0177496778 /NCGR_PEP_ID=MMETSP0369-20130122/34688_1 /TAXON_ID=447022 ORGANISM="Scrippsiella hangoei-like, Strain SHHI-4" /NCGR_SAMPLE_ID=MMETSP0369 /ASSEMBLY_ACC=CAM_ASM_000364 /LENGTH=203 /DNA_ID=CAMNT_0018973871 /DNA_START=230 /DNA_END=839 /DNA_ORIENTATION=-
MFAATVGPSGCSGGATEMASRLQAPIWRGSKIGLTDVAAKLEGANRSVVQGLPKTSATMLATSDGGMVSSPYGPTGCSAAKFCSRPPVGVSLNDGGLALGRAEEWPAASSGAELHDQRSFGFAPSWSSKSCNSYEWDACDSPSGCDGAHVALLASNSLQPTTKPPSTNAEGCPCGGIGMAGATATAVCGVFVGPATAHKTSCG